MAHHFNPSANTLRRSGPTCLGDPQGLTCYEQNLEPFLDYKHQPYSTAATSCYPTSLGRPQLALANEQPLGSCGHTTQSVCQHTHTHTQKKKEVEAVLVSHRTSNTTSALPHGMWQWQQHATVTPSAWKWSHTWEQGMHALNWTSRMTCWTLPHGSATRCPWDCVQAATVLRPTHERAARAE